MGVFPDDEEQRTRRDGLDVVEGVEVHELHVACERGVRGRPVRRPFGRELSARRAVEGVEFPLDRGGVFRQLVCRAAGVCGFPARKLRVALFRRFGQYPLPVDGHLLGLRENLPHQHEITAYLFKQFFRVCHIFSKFIRNEPDIQLFGIVYCL